MSTSPQIVLEAKNISKKISGRPIIKDISFEVTAGEIFGFLGPNGSGKTTTIRMLTGMIKPDSGSIKIMGHDIQTEFRKAIAHMGAIVENPALYTFMTGWQNLKQFARISGVPISDERIMQCARIVELDQRVHDLVGTYSLGMKQRLGIAQALLANPAILILDEPTNGMDPSGIKDMRLLIKRLVSEENLSVFISSHLLSEIEHLCDRVLIINQGQSIVSGRVDDLAGTGANSQFILSLNEQHIEPAIKLLKQQNIRAFEENSKLVVQTQKENIPDLVHHLYQADLKVYLIHTRDSSLEDYFLSVTKGEQ